MRSATALHFLAWTLSQCSQKEGNHPPKKSFHFQESQKGDIFSAFFLFCHARVDGKIYLRWISPVPNVHLTSQSSCQGFYKIISLFLLIIVRWKITYIYIFRICIGFDFSVGLTIMQSIIIFKQAVIGLGFVLHVANISFLFRK